MRRQPNAPQLQGRFGRCYSWTAAKRQPKWGGNIVLANECDAESRKIVLVAFAVCVARRPKRKKEKTQKINHIFASAVSSSDDNASAAISWIFLLLFMFIGFVCRLIRHTVFRRLHRSSFVAQINNKIFKMNCCAQSSIAYCTFFISFIIYGRSSTVSLTEISDEMRMPPRLRDVCCNSLNLWSRAQTHNRAEHENRATKGCLLGREGMHSEPDTNRSELWIVNCCHSAMQGHIVLKLTRLSVDDGQRTHIWLVLGTKCQTRGECVNVWRPSYFQQRRRSPTDSAISNENAFADVGCGRCPWSESQLFYLTRTAARRPPPLECTQAFSWFVPLHFNLCSFRFNEIIIVFCTPSCHGTS